MPRLVDATDPAVDDLQGGSVLAVDDDPRNLIAVDVALGGIAARIVKAQSGEEALRHLLTEDFTLIILDVVMPDLGGFEMAEMVRQRARSRHTPIIFVTAARPDDSDVRRGYELGAVDYLLKPINPEILRAKVSFFVELQQRTNEVRRQAERLQELERAEGRRALAAERRRWEARALKREMEEQRRLTASLEKADQRKDEFLATLAHELRNPLTPIVTGLEILRTRCDQDEVCTRAHVTMTRQARHLTRLVDDLVDVARISTGKIALKTSVVEMDEVVMQAVESCTSLVERGRHRLVVESNPLPVKLAADPARISQVVANLISNSARYTEPGGTIRVQWSALDDDTVELRVADDGCGIEPEALPHVFDMFFQRDAREGLGIGLTLVHKLVTLHGGRVEARSDGPGEGSEFIVRLPRGDYVSEDEEAPKPDDPHVDDHDELPHPSPLRVALVEDDPDVRDLMSELLRSWGHEVVAAATGPAGVELVIRQRPDVAFIDLGLPELDGRGVARQVKAQLGADGPRLVAMTGFSQPDHVHGATEAGFDAYIVKPSSPEEIQRVLSRPMR